MANKWNEKEQGAKRRRSNQGTRGATRTQPAASNPNKNTKSTDTNRNSGRPAAAKPAPKAAPKAAPKQTKPKTVYYSNKNKGVKGVGQAAANAIAKNPRAQAAAKDTAGRARVRLANQTGAQRFVTGRDIPTVMNKPKTFQQIVTPLEQVKADSLAGPRYWTSRATVPSKPLTAEQQKKKNQQTAKQSGFNARARKQTLSSYDQKLSQGKQFQIQQAKQRYDEAKAKGDKAGMEKAHREAERLRYTSGYSGGATGNERIAPKLSQDDYNRLNSSGQLAMTQARMTRDRATTEDEIARADRRIEEILNAPGYQNRGRDINTARGMRETAEGRSTMLGATREQKEQDAAGLKNATLAGLHLGAGGAGHWLEATDWTIANRNREQNMAKWLQDADDYEAARSDLEYYDNYVQTFGEPPAGMNRNVLQMRLNSATQAKAQLERMQTDPHSAYYDETVAQRLGMPTDTQSYWEKMIRQGQQEQLASQEGLSPAEKWINDLYISGIQTIPTTAAALIPGGQGGALAGLASAARGLTLAGMGASAAGNRMTELEDAGQAFDQAYRNATVAGIIEAGTEMIGVEKLASAAAGKIPQNALRAILEQGLAEGGEEALSYGLNLAYNKAADLPGQEFSLRDLVSQAASGAVMGAVHMGAGVMINSLAASGAVSQERAQRNYQAWQASADQARSLLNDAKQWYAMMDQGAVSQEEAEAALSQVSQQINGQAEPVTREWLARQEELLDIEENAIRGAITRQEARDQQSQILDQVTAQNRDSEANRMAAEWDEEERQARAAQNAAVSARTRLDQRLEDWRWQQDEPASTSPYESAVQKGQEAVQIAEEEKARRDAVVQLQAETPPITYERSGLPPTSFLGAAIDARREARARAEVEAQVRRDQEIARQNRVAAEQQATTNGSAEISTTIRRNEQAQVQQPVSRLEGLASTFGESGAASLRTIGGKMVTGQGAFVRDFTDVYNQVLGGRSESQVSRPAGMSDANYFAAVTAAQNDRQTGWDLDILKASKAAGRNVNAGVDWRDQYVRQMDRKTARTVDGLAKALGVKVVFAEKGSILTAGGTAANAEITGNVVRIEKGNPNPVRMLIGHELTHRMQDVSPDTYRAFRDYAMSVPGSMEALERTVSLYQRAGAFRAQDNARQMAMDEVTADFAGSLLENSEQLQEFIRRNYENRTMLEVIRDFFRDLAAKLTGRQKAQADEAVRLLEEAIKGASARVKQNERQGRQSDNNRSREGLAGEGEAIDPTSRMSLSSMGDAFGFTAVVDQETGGVKYYRVNGRQVKRVTTRDVKQSKMYQLVELARQNGTISAAEAEKQASYLRRLMNLVLKTNDSQMIYAFEGSMLWSAVKDNADKQYGMTIDFEAICKKTEQMVAAMSEAMTRKGRGLTLDEINELYGRVIEAGEPVPCPPCYVFTRWIGLGGLLDNIKSFQTEFADTADGTAKARKRLDEIRGILSDEIADLRAEDDARVQKNLEAQARGEKKSKKDVTPKSDDDLTNQAKKARLAELDKAEGKLITKRNKALNKLQFDNLSEAERQKVQASIDAIDEEYNDLTNQMRTLRMYSWLKDVRLSDTYKEVPDSVLFNLRAGEEFASRFADTWAFRTGQGAYYGKAITPYTDMRTGEIIQGVHKSARDIKIGKENPFSGEFDARNLTKKQADELDSARLKVRQQNMRGGVRMQSVSDFRYEYGLDYIQAFFELQSIGAAIQTYSKVVEFVPMVASTGGFVNMSLIPWGTGFRNGKLAYSSVTGMDAEAAFKLQKQWDTAGTILIGVSDEHIRAAMADNDIYFIIPYHLSGGREDVIRQMLTSLGEKAEKYTDYSNVQSEKFPSQQNPVLALRNKILTAGKTFAPTRAEQALLDSNEFLRGLYDRKFNRPEDPLYMLPMMSEDTKHIYPYEYWDVNSTYKTADVNGQRYLQWCEDLGVVPKFSGDKDGNKDFRNDKGYWKLLIDRRMYGRDGSYNPLTPINATGLNLNQLDRERARQTFGEAMTAPADLRKTQEIVDKAFPETAGKRFSITPQSDAGVDNVVAFPQNGRRSDAAMDETRIGELRASIQYAEDKLEFADVDDLSDVEVKRLQSRLMKDRNELDKLIGKERSLKRKTSIQDLLDNLDDYRRTDLESLAEQISEGAWDDYEELDDADLRDGIREMLEERAADMSPLEAQAAKYGFNVRPPERYSIGTEGYDRARLMRENQEIRDRLETWRSGQNQAVQTKVSDKIISDLTARLANEYRTDMPRDEIAAEIRKIYDSLGKGSSFDKVYQDANALAASMVEQASDEEESLYTAYQDLRSYIRGTDILVSKDLKDQIPGYNGLRQSMMGRATLKNGEETNIDTVFAGLAEHWPEFFDPEIDTTQAAKLERIGEVLQDIYNREETEVPGLPEGYLATEILASYFDSPAVRSSMAQKAGARSEAMRARHKERYDAALEKARAQKDKELKRKSERYLTAKRKNSQKQKERELRAKIQRHCGRLSAKLKSGTDKQHVPEVMQRIVATALDSINLGSGFTLVYDENGKAKRVKDGSGETTKRTEAFEELRNFYQQIITADPDEALAGEMPEIISKIVVSEELPRMIDGIIGFRDTPIANLGKADLDKIWETVKAIETTISTYDKALGQARFETISEPAFAIRDYASPKKDRRNYVGGMKHVDRLLNVGMLKPIYFLYRFGDGGKMIWKMIEDAQGANIRYLDEIRAYQEEHFKPGLAKRLEKEKHTFNFDGQEIELTTAQLINLYNLRKSEETDGHILEGGFRPDQIVKGIRDVTPAAPWHFTAEQIGEMLDVVAGDAELVRIADAMMDGIKPQAAHGNAASMEVYGIKKYRKRNYWPIEVDKNQTQTDVKNEAVSKTVAGSGFAKARNPHANNAIILRSAFDVYDDHVVGMAKYAAWLGPLENLRRILNFRYKDETGHFGGGVKEMLTKIIGKDGPGYYKKLMDDLNAGIKATSDNPFQQFIGSYKAAAIAGNIRVVAQQPTSIMRALSEIDPQDFLLGMAEARPGQWENEIKKYAPIAIWKDWGYFTADTGRQMRNIFWGDDNVLQTANNIIMNNRVFSPGAADAVTWTAIWNAIKRETKRTRKDLDPDSEEFMYAVRDRYNEVINLTQVVDGIPQRSQLMRSENDVTKMATSFMGEPTTTYNMLTFAIHKARTSTGAERGKAMRHLARTTVALATSIALNAAAQSLVDAMRDDDKDEGYWEKFFQAFFGLEGETRKDKIKSAILNGNLGAGMNPLTYIPFIKDVVSKRQGYKVTRMDMDIISRVMDSYDAVVKAMNGEGKKTRKNAWINFIAECSRFLGVPVANIKRDILSGVSTVFQATGNYRYQYELEKFLYNIEGTGNFSEFAKLAYLAKRDGDTEAYEAIRADLIANGPKSEKDVDKKIAELEKKAVTDTEEFQTTLAQKMDAYHTMLEASPQYQEMDEELQGKVQDKLDSYAQYQVLGQSMEVDGSDFEKVQAAEASGVPAVDWAVLTVLKGSRHNYEENGKTIKVQDQMIETIDQMGGTDEEKSARYRALYDSDKNNPWVKK